MMRLAGGALAVATFSALFPSAAEARPAYRQMAAVPLGASNPVRRRALISNGVDGAISAYQRTAPDRFQALEPIRTIVSGRRMTVDPATGCLSVAAADTTPNPTPSGRARVVAGTLRVFVFDSIP